MIKIRGKVTNLAVLTEREVQVTISSDAIAGTDETGFARWIRLSVPATDIPLLGEWVKITIESEKRH